MRLTLTEQQASELEALGRVALREMSHEIAATDNSHYRAELVGRRHIIEEAVAALHGSAEADPAGGHQTASGRLDQDRVWTVELVFTEDEDRTRADARMRAAHREWHGWGRARRNPLDPDVPAIGEELAAARALSDLSHQLIEVAAHGVEAFEGHPVRIHA